MSASRIIAADAAGLEIALATLARGAAIGMPTETVYGLAADASSAEAVASIYAIKARPSFNPLIAHVASVAAARLEGQFDERAEALAEAFWPGPLTLVVPVAASGMTCELARAGLTSIGLRVPAHPVALALLTQFQRPLAAPSANPSGKLSPTSAQEVASELGSELELVLDGGRCSAGLESSIVALMPDTQAALLRPGAIARDQIEAIIGPLAKRESEEIIAPGALQSHYAPRAGIRLDAKRAEAGELLLGFGPDAPADAVNLSRTADLTEAAANLYQSLRKLDATGTKQIAVMPIPEHGLGEAINDRLQRAAAPL